MVKIDYQSLRHEKENLSVLWAFIYANVLFFEMMRDLIKDFINC